MIASFCLSLSLPVIADSMKPGATQLTVMLRVAISCASALEKPIIPAFEATVVGLAGIAGDADHRGDVDDAAEAAAHHRMGELAGQPEHRPQIDVDHRVEILVRHAHEQPVLGDAGIVDEDVDAFELGLGLLAERLDLGGAGQIGRKDLRAAAELAGQRLELLDAGAVQADRRALRMQARAIASPMPPDAPVTSALRPVKSNMSIPSKR